MQHLLCVSIPLLLYDRTRFKFKRSLVFSINFSDINPKRTRFTLNLLTFVSPPLPNYVVKQLWGLEHSDSMTAHAETLGPVTDIVYKVICWRGFALNIICWNGLSEVSQQGLAAHNGRIGGFIYFLYWVAIKPLRGKTDLHMHFFNQCLFSIKKGWQTGFSQTNFWVNGNLVYTRLFKKMKKGNVC